ncbi:MAG: peptidoglycan DD-metalloendopeptidase family protein, partial [Aquificales bacterium]|nr:peptidoglycan DD-metalloendopeptidase family protein [Aquificales bacterium]
LHLRLQSRPSPTRYQSTKVDFANVAANLFATLLFLMGCGGREVVLPTAVPIAIAPEITTAQAEAGEDVVVAGEVIVVETAVSVTIDATIPTPEGEGVRPGVAEQNYVRSAGPAPRNTEEWRPPPMSVPLSYNPDDHYWLIRPIPSGSRNYDLEWYPFGNDVQAADVPAYRVHHGVDFPNETGTPVLAAGSGTVIHAGSFPSPRNGVNYYGNTVVIQHDWQWLGKDLFTLYAHTLELFVEEGDYVEQGQVIAGVGSSGEVTGPHLHLEVRVGTNEYVNARNPALWLAPYEGWGTLAGQLVDRRGRMIPGAKLELRLPDANENLRQQSTYATTVRSDDIWQENFVIGDVPAGQYELHITVADVAYKRDVEILPGQTTFEIIATEFSFNPTSTPIPLPTPLPTLAITGTVPADDIPLLTTPTPEP